MIAIQLTGLVLLGWLIGYLVNYLSDVLPYTRSLSQPMCHVCETQFNIRDYLTLRACRACGKAREIRVWVVQILAAVVTPVLWLMPVLTERLGFWVSLLLMAYFAVVVVIDIEHRLILHPVSLFGAVLGLVIGVWRHGWLETIAGGVAGFLIMLALFWLGGVFARGIAKMRGQELDEVALGFGDVNLSGILGLLLGWPGILAGLVAAILFGGLGSIIVLARMVIMRKYQAFVAIPYAPYLVLAAVLLLFRP